MGAETKTLSYYRRLPYRMRLEPASDSDGCSYWIAYFEELPGCKTDGESEVDAVEKLHELFDELIQLRLEENLDIPEPQNLPIMAQPVLWVASPKRIRFGKPAMPQAQDTDASDTAAQVRLEDKAIGVMVA